LLPKLRGAAPIQAAIRDGHTETGVTIMRMVQALDAGPSLLQVRTPIPDDETFGELRLRLAEMGALAMIEALALIDLGKATETPQDDAHASYASKVDRAMTRIDWSSDATTVSRIIRAYDPRPGALTTARGGEVKLFGARLADGSGAAGEVLSIDNTGMIVACGSGKGGGAIQVANVHPSGKRRLTPREWAAGRGVSVGERLS
jgi:methionyl-tRNA formyltransferase